MHQFEIINEKSTSPILLLCEHASPHIPQELKNLGLHFNTIKEDPEMFYDPGAAEVVRRVAERLNATALLGINSRLVVDLNRNTNHPNLITPTFHGRDIPANQNMTEDEKRERIARYFRPFRCMAHDVVLEMALDGLRPIILTVHSFSADNAEIYRTDPSVKKLPLDMSLLYANESSPVVQTASRFLAAQSKFKVIDNHPYDLRKFKAGTIYDLEKDMVFCDGIGIEMDSAKARNPNFQCDAANLLSDMLEDCLKQRPLRKRSRPSSLRS